MIRVGVFCEREGKILINTLLDGSIKVNMDLDMAIEILQTSQYLEEIDLLSKMGKRVWVIGTRRGLMDIPVR